MWRFEWRWAAVILAAFLGRSLASTAPTLPIDYLATLRAVRRASTQQVVWAVRLGIWLVTWSPVWLLRRGCTFAALPDNERAALLERLQTHRWFAVRELTSLLKLVASIALLGDASMRSHSGYDRVAASASWSAPEYSQTRPKLPLPRIEGATRGR